MTKIDRLKLRNDFIGEFCNDHNGEPRWLRGVAMDMPDLLDMILKFLESDERLD